MGMTFFAKMQIVERSYYYLLPEKQLMLYRALQDWVIGCSFSSSKITQFICQNYDKSSVELSRLYSHIKKKSPDTWRSQISKVSKELNNLFDPKGEMLEAFSEACDGYISFESQKYFEYLRLTLKGLATDNPYFLDDVIAISVSSHESLSKYNLNDCKAEIKVLHMLTKANIEALIKSVNKDKLNYLFRVLNSPILINTRIKTGNTIRTNHKVNTDKVELLQLLGMFSNEEIPISETANQNINKYRSRYGFSSMTEIERELEKFVSNNPPTHLDNPDIQRQEILRKALDLYTVAGAKEYFKKFDIRLLKSEMGNRTMTEMLKIKPK